MRVVCTPDRSKCRITRRKDELMAGIDMNFDTQTNKAQERSEKGTSVGDVLEENLMGC